MWYNNNFYTFVIHYFRSNQDHWKTTVYFAEFESFGKFESEFVLNFQSADLPEMPFLTNLKLT